MEKQMNAYQYWLFLTFFLILNAWMRMNRGIVVETIYAWVKPYTIPIIAIAITFLSRLGMRIGDWMIAGLKRLRIPAGLLILATIVLYFWWGSWIR